jgi:osmotically inducible protein OsmC
MSDFVISYTREGDVHSIDTGGQALGTLVIDNATIPAESRGGTAKQLLGASALYCYCAALAAALETRGATYKNIQARASLRTGSNERGQSRVTKISIEARVVLTGEDDMLFERVERVMRPGCLVTGSLHDGIQMEYNLQATYEE